MMRSSGVSSGSGRERLSVESRNRVTTSMPASSHQVRKSAILSAPRRWPSLTSSRPIERAQRRLASVITPTGPGFFSRFHPPGGGPSYHPRVGSPASPPPPSEAPFVPLEDGLADHPACPHAGHPSPPLSDGGAASPEAVAPGRRPAPRPQEDPDAEQPTGP